MIRCLYDELVSVSSLKLKFHDKNRNQHPPEQIERLAEILKFQGIRYPVKISKQSGLITSGHGRLLAAELNGWREFPVNYQDYDSPEQEYADVQADNAIASWAELDLSAINLDLGDLGPDFNIDYLGIKDFTLEPIEKLEPQCDEDEVPEHVETKTQLGDIYKLGSHRLMCGDCTSIDAVEKLMEGQKADMVFTDPPYGVNYEGGALTKRTRLANDHSTDIYSDVLPLLHMFTDHKAPLYIWHAAGYADMASKLADAGFKIRSQIIWNKNQAQFGALSAQYNTLIACEKIHRKCFTMELDPHYCDVIVARWEKYTGKKAELIHG